jgi:hypothetical protein
MSDDSRNRRAEEGDDSRTEARPGWHAYVRFGAMILTGMVVMYWTMFAGSWEWSHIRFSESRIFMALTMGGAMGLVMLAWMLHMYRNVKANIVVAVVSVLLLGGGIALDRSQVTVDDVAYLEAMIPHHSLAITRSERAGITDVRVCELAKSISEAQRREILEMSWLVDDIRAHGVARNAAEAAERPVPDYDEKALRQC